MYLLLTNGHPYLTLLSAGKVTKYITVSPLAGRMVTEVYESDSTIFSIFMERINVYVWVPLERITVSEFMEK